MDLLMDVISGHISLHDAGPVVGTVYVNKLIERLVHTNVNIVRVLIKPCTVALQMLPVKPKSCISNSGMIYRFYLLWLP